MRNCPHCAQQIRDEAIYCKHCHRDVEPPLWTTSMRRCPYCAEWIDLEHENCQYCGSVVGTVDLTESSAFLDSLLNDDFALELDQAPSEPADSEDSDQHAESEPPVFSSGKPFFDDETSDLAHSLRSIDDDASEWTRNLEAAQDEPSDFERRPRFTDREPAEFSERLDFPESEPSELDQDRPVLEPDQTEYQPERIADRPDFSHSLRRSLIEPDANDEPEPERESEPEPTYRSAAAGRPSYEPEPDETESDYVSTPGAEPEYEAPSSIWTSEVDRLGEFRSQAPQQPVARRAIPTGLLQGLAAIVLIGGVGFGLVALARGPAGAALAETLATDIPADTATPAPAAARSTAPALPPETQTAVDPTEVGSVGTGECVLWDQITLDDEGRELCAYGVIRRWFAVSEVPFVAIFSEEAGTFAIIDRTTTHPVGPGDCIVARGPVEVMSRTRPDIDLNGTLELCPEEWLPEE